MKCCICGTVRECGKYLDNIFVIMEKIGTLFEDYKIILYYDKSIDDTLDKIKNYSIKNDKLNYFVNTSEMLKYRTHRIAKGRNKCLELIEKDYSDYEYFIMMDCDDRCDYKINLELLKNYLIRDDWDSLSFNHPAGYYDTWALSKRPFVLSCHHLSKSALGGEYIKKIISNTPRNKLIKCFSAFNGFAIYKKKKFENCWYDGNFRLDYFSPNLIKENIVIAGPILFKSNDERHQDCEHRFFHFSAIKKNNARIRISPLCLFSL
jgi:hypothetical protein